MLISITRFHLKNLWLYPSFFLDTYRVVKQVRRSEGCIHMRIKPFTLYTLTVWKSADDMHKFRNSGAHLQAMKESGGYGKIESSSWEADSIPDWSESIGKLSEHR